MLIEKFDELIIKLKENIIDFYRERLVTIAIYGSVSSGTVGPDSDIDIFICAMDLPRGRRDRIREFETVEESMIPLLKSLTKEGLFIALSPAIKTQEETELGSPIFIDMTENVKILFDKDDFFSNYLKNLKDKLITLGSKKIKIGNAWYWDLVPDYNKIREVSI